MPWGRAIVGFLGEDDLHPRAVKLFLQQHLVGKIAAQTVHGPDQDRLDPAACNRVAQGFQRGTIQRRATETVVGEHVLHRDDPTAAVRVFQHRFGLERVVLVGDRGLLTETQIKHLKRHPGLGWISALRHEAIRQLVDAQEVQPSLFDERHLAEIRTEAYPGERLVVCYNPMLA